MPENSPPECWSGIEPDFRRIVFEKSRFLAGLAKRDVGADTFAARLLVIVADELFRRAGKARRRVSPQDEIDHLLFRGLGAAENRHVLKVASFRQHRRLKGRTHAPSGGSELFRIQLSGRRRRELHFFLSLYLLVVGPRAAGRPGRIGRIPRLRRREKAAEAKESRRRSGNQSRL